LLNYLNIFLFAQIDESIGLALNKTFGGNSVNSTFYHWDQDESFLLTDLDIRRHQLQ